MNVGEPDGISRSLRPEAELFKQKQREDLVGNVNSNS